MVTYGVTTENSIDVSPEAYSLLNSEEYPRAMSWYVTKCPANGHNIYYQFKTGSNQWWTSFWVRNPSLPIEYVDVKNSNHADWFRLTRISDGSFTDANGFGSSTFTIRITTIDGSQIEDTYQSFTPGGLLESSGQF
ncbi:MAG: hypothetical protein GY756_15415 [bacterium]|nr:hypothetical protein [bacterium]